MTDKGLRLAKGSSISNSTKLSTAIGRAVRSSLLNAGFSKKMRSLMELEEEDSNCLRKDYTKVPKR